MRAYSKTDPITLKITRKIIVRIDRRNMLLWSFVVIVSYNNIFFRSAPAVILSACIGPLLIKFNIVYLNTVNCRYKWMFSKKNHVSSINGNISQPNDYEEDSKRYVNMNIDKTMCSMVSHYIDLDTTLAIQRETGCRGSIQGKNLCSDSSW